MSVANDIVATYRGPGRVVRRLIGQGENEPRALVILMSACVLIYIAQWPGLSRQAHIEGVELNPLLGAGLLAWVFIAPLLFYVIAFVTHHLLRIIHRAGTAYGARIALFWSLLASAPLVLLHGLVAGFIGDGTALTLVGALWFGVFLWFWLRGLSVLREVTP